MFVKNARHIRFGLFVIAFLAIFLAGVGVLPAQEEAEIKRLQKERIAVLDQVVKKMTTHYEAGTIRIEVLANAEREALQAKLEASESAKERVEALREILGHANGVLRRIETRFKAGVVMEHDVLQAKANVLECRINLLKEERRIKAVEKEKAAEPKK